MEKKESNDEKRQKLNQNSKKSYYKHRDAKLAYMRVKEKCTICGMPYNRASKYSHNKSMRHIEALKLLENNPNTNNDEKLYLIGKTECDVCGVILKYLSKYEHVKSKRHKKALLTYVQKPKICPIGKIECDICGCFFKQTSLNTHLKTLKHKKALEITPKK